jgi:hypothetical protein
VSIVCPIILSRVVENLKQNNTTVISSYIAVREINWQKIYLRKHDVAMKFER